MNESEVDERLEELSEEPPAGLPLQESSRELQELNAAALAAPAPAAVPLGPSWLRLAYAVEFLIALIAIISLWSEIGGEGHLDLMPWYIKLGCIVGLAWCCMRFTAALVEQQLVEQQKIWTRRTLGWFAGILLFCIAMGGITYYYHLHEEPDDGDEDTTAAAVRINTLGTFIYHGSTRTGPSIQIRILARSRVRAGDRVPVRSYGGDPRVRL